MNDIERRLLNLLQRDLPLAPQPFAHIGLKLNIPENDTIQRIQQLEDGGIVRYIGPVVDTRKLGYFSTLVAMRVLPAHLDEVAAVVSLHPGVSHNYARDHQYNLWFTLTVQRAESIQDAVGKFRRQPGVQATVVLPALRQFKSNVFFDMMGRDKLEAGLNHQDNVRTKASLAEAITLSPEEKAVLKELQANLPLKSRPFDQMAEQIGIGVDTFLEGARALQAKGIVRHYGASLNHRRVGFIANAMTCWLVTPSDVESVGTKIAAYPAVSHCYERQVNGDWKYNLFAMIHGRSRLECEAVAAKISLAAGIGQYVSLYSTKEYKKERVRLLD